MKKIGLVLVIIMQSSFLYGMELSSCYGTTKINVTKGSPYNLDGKVELIVLEKNEQQLLSERYADNWLVGDVALLRHRSLYRCFNSVGSNSDDGNDDNSCYKNLLKDVYRRRLQSMGIAVVEPLIFKSQYSGEYYYFVEKIDKEGNGYPSGIKYWGDEALEQASDDLALCYNNVLSAGLQRLDDKKEKSIALPALGTAVDFPREKAALVAVPEILKFIKNNPNAYDRIELFVKKQSEFEVYQTLLNFYTKIEKIGMDSFLYNCYKNDQY